MWQSSVEFDCHVKESPVSFRGDSKFVMCSFPIIGRLLHAIIDLL